MPIFQSGKKKSMQKARLLQIKEIEKLMVIAEARKPLRGRKAYEPPSHTAGVFMQMNIIEQKLTCF